MTHAPLLPANELWLNQIFAAQSVSKGGVVRRKKADVERKVGRKRLEHEVRKRGFHMIECGTQIVIICDPKEIRVIC